MDTPMHIHINAQIPIYAHIYITVPPSSYPSYSSCHTKIKGIFQLRNIFKLLIVKYLRIRNELFLCRCGAAQGMSSFLMNVDIIHHHITRHLSVRCRLCREPSIEKYPDKKPNRHTAKEGRPDGFPSLGLYHVTMTIRVSC